MMKMVTFGSEIVLVALACGVPAVADDSPPTPVATAAVTEADVEAGVRAAREYAEAAAHALDIDGWKKAHARYVVTLTTASEKLRAAAMAVFSDLRPEVRDALHQQMHHLSRLSGDYAEMAAVAAALGARMEKRPDDEVLRAAFKKFSYAPCSGVDSRLGTTPSGSSGLNPTAAPAAPGATPATSGRPRSYVSKSLKVTYDKFSDSTTIEAELYATAISTGLGRYALIAKYAGREMTAPPDDVLFVSTDASPSISHTVTFLLDGRTRLQYTEDVGRFGVTAVRIPRADFLAMASAGRVEAKVDYIESSLTPSDMGILRDVVAALAWGVPKSK